MSPCPSRRALIAALATGPCLPAAARRPAAVAGGMPEAGAPPSPALLAAWARFRQGFLHPEGRILDSGNGGVSHSEGQGWAMFCAERCADRASFDHLWGWTRRVLARPRDSLLAWRYMPGQANPVPDGNNATDGDLFVAAALLLAARRWSEPAYALAGAAMAHDVLRLLVREVAGLTVLLPGAQGFEEAEEVVLNPSYYAFPILGTLARAVPDPAWFRLAGDGLALLRRARFGRWSLPPDWVAMRRGNGSLSLPSRWPPRFSYDAVRVPLYLCWAGLGSEPAAQAAATFWGAAPPGRLPAWVDLRTHQASPYRASAGVQAVARYVAEGTPGQARNWDTDQESRQDDYYSAVLKTLIEASGAAVDQ